MSELSTASWLSNLLRRQFALVLRRPVDMLNPLLFFAIVIVLFPLGLGPAPATLGQFAAGILWIVALLATLMGSEGLFRSDFEDGSLDQLLLAPQPAYFAVLVMLLVHWLVSGALLALLSPLFAVMLSLPFAGMAALLCSLLLGSAVMVVLGAIGAALTVGLGRGGVLVVLLIAPFYMPVLIFGVSAVEAALAGGSAAAQLALLAAMLSLALALGPLAVVAALRISVDA